MGSLVSETLALDGSRGMAVMVMIMRHIQGFKKFRTTLSLSRSDINTVGSLPRVAVFSDPK